MTSRCGVPCITAPTHRGKARRNCQCSWTIAAWMARSGWKTKRIPSGGEGPKNRSTTIRRMASGRSAGRTAILVPTPRSPKSPTGPTCSREARSWPETPDLRGGYPTMAMRSHAARTGRGPGNQSHALAPVLYPRIGAESGSPRGHSGLGGRNVGPAEGPEVPPGSSSSTGTQRAPVSTDRSARGTRSTTSISRSVRAVASSSRRSTATSSGSGAARRATPRARRRVGWRASKIQTGCGSRSGDGPPRRSADNFRRASQGPEGPGEGTNRIEIELTQWRVFFLVIRSPRNTWPRCPSHRAHRISIRRPSPSDSRRTAPGISSSKLGHPQPESNLSDDR